MKLQLFILRNTIRSPVNPRNQSWDLHYWRSWQMSAVIA